MNQLHVGTHRNIAAPPGGAFLFITDEVPPLPNISVFDPLVHSFNPLKDITHKRARELADVLYAIYPQGENTLTVRDGRMALAPAMMAAKTFDKVTGTIETQALVADVLFSPVVRSVLCSPRRRFPFKPRAWNYARIDRKELGDRDALVLGFFLISHFQGQLIIPDFGFYGRDAHVALIREDRLIAGLNFLDELPERLRNAALLIEEKDAAGALYDDAVLLAKFAGLRPDPTREDNDFNRFISRAMA